MDIYFAGSIRGGRVDEDIRKQLISHTRSCGVNVLCEHSDAEASAGMTDQEIHNRDMAWIYQSSGIIAEVSLPSLGAGYEIGRAHNLYKPVLALYWRKPDTRLSAMIGGAPHIETVRYDRRTEAGILLAKTAISNFLQEVEYGIFFNRQKILDNY